MGMSEFYGPTSETESIATIHRAIDLGVYPFVVPLRPVPGSLMADFAPPPREAVEAVYRRIVPQLLARGLSSANVVAGCAAWKCSRPDRFRSFGKGRRRCPRTNRAC